MFRKAVFVLISIMTLLTGCTTPETHIPLSNDENVHIVLATDLHYLSPSLTDYGEPFMRMLKRGDGKLTEKSPEILDTLIRKTEEEKADALVLTGDLTFNGEMKSLQDIRKKLKTVEEEGIPVLVIPGNHDINYPYAYSYSGNQATKTDNISQLQFQKTMQQFGYSDSLYHDKESFSYVYPLRENLWILAIDCNTNEAIGTVKEETVSWMESVLQKAKEQNIQVISISHQNLLSHSTFMSDGFVMNNCRTVKELLKKYDVSLHLSGHSHLQNTAQEDGITDICMESISVAPLRYSTLDINADGQWHYEKKSLGIDQKEAYDRFADTVRMQTEKELDELSITEKEKKEMMEFAVKANYAYFSDETEQFDNLRKEEGWKLWKEKGSDTFWYQYMNSYLG